MLNWTTGIFYISNLKGPPSREHKNFLSSFRQNYLTLSAESDATSLFSTVCHTLCDTYIDFPQSANSEGKVSFLKHGGVKSFYGAEVTADCRIPEFMNFW
jgi:hypothetical protein